MPQLIPLMRHHLLEGYFITVSGILIVVCERVPTKENAIIPIHRQVR